MTIVYGINKISFDLDNFFVINNPGATDATDACRNGIATAAPAFVNSCTTLQVCTNYNDG